MKNPQKERKSDTKDKYSKLVYTFDSIKMDHINQQIQIHQNSNKSSTISFENNLHFVRVLFEFDGNKCCSGSKSGARWSEHPNDLILYKIDANSQKKRVSYFRDTKCGSWINPRKTEFSIWNAEHDFHDLICDTVFPLCLIATGRIE